MGCVFHVDPVLQGCLDYESRVLCVFKDAGLLADQVVSFALLGRKLRGEGQGDDHDRGDEVSPEASNDTNKSSNVSLGVVVSVADRGHRNDSAPHGVPQIPPVMATARDELVWHFSRSHCEAEHEDGDEDHHDQNCVWALL